MPGGKDFLKKYWRRIVVAGVVVVGGLFFATRPGSVPPSAPGQARATHYYETAVSESPPHEYQWTGLPAEPKYIDLPSIGARGYIQKVGITEKQEIGAPSNIHFAGWFSGSSVPGMPGLSIIDGHLDGRSQPGIFFDLIRLQPGDRFSVELGDSSIKTYAVLDISSVHISAALNVLFSQRPDVPSQLNLITCGGAFNDSSGEYEERIIVTAKLVQPN